MAQQLKDLQKSSVDLAERMRWLARMEAGSLQSDNFAYCLEQVGKSLGTIERKWSLELERKLKALRQEQDELQSEKEAIRAKEKMLAGYEKVVEDAKERLRASEERICKEQEQLAVDQKERQEWRSMLRRQVGELVSDRESSECQAKALETLLSQLSVSSQEALDELRRGTDDLRSQLRESMAREESLRQDAELKDKVNGSALEGAEKSAVELRSKLMAEREEVARLKGIVATQKDEILTQASRGDGFLVDSAEATARINAMDASLEEARSLMAQLKIREQSLGKDLEEAKAVIVQMTGTDESLRAELTKANGTNDQLTNRQKSLEEDMGEARGVIDELTAHKQSLEADLAKATSENYRLTNRQESLERDLEEAKGAISRLKSQEARLESDLQKARDTNVQLVSCQESLEEELEERRGAFSDLKTRQETVELELEQAISANDQLRSLQKSLEDDLDGAKATIAQLENREESLEADLAKAAETNRQLRSYQKSIKKDLEEAREIVSEMQSREIWSEEQLQKGKDANSQLKRLEERLKAELEGAKEASGRLMRREGRLESELEEAREANDQLHRREVWLEAALEEARVEIAQLKGREESLDVGSSEDVSENVDDIGESSAQDGLYAQQMKTPTRQASQTERGQPGKRTWPTPETRGDREGRPRESTPMTTPRRPIKRVRPEGSEGQLIHWNTLWKDFGFLVQSLRPATGTEMEGLDVHEMFRDVVMGIVSSDRSRDHLMELVGMPADECWYCFAMVCESGISNWDSAVEEGQQCSKHRDGYCWLVRTAKNEEFLAGGGRLLWRQVEQ